MEHVQFGTNEACAFRAGQIGWKFHWKGDFRGSLETVSENFDLCLGIQLGVANCSRAASSDSLNPAWRRAS